VGGFKKLSDNDGHVADHYDNENDGCGHQDLHNFVSSCVGSDRVKLCSIILPVRIDPQQRDREV
jgi:hypothetical protein